MTSQTELTDLAGVPDDARTLWTSLVDAPLMPVHELFTQVRQYETMLKQRGQWSDDDVDGDLAVSLCVASNRLLGSLTDDSPERTRRLVQAAVRYFVIADDADGDLDSILGLDDDARVMNAVMIELGHNEWLVDAP